MRPIQASTWVISIHAPSRERRYECCRHWICQPISIHAPSRERQQYLSAVRYQAQHFNPRSLTGATILLLPVGASTFYFNPRSLTGATNQPPTASSITLFQSTLPHGSDRRKLLSGLDDADFNPRSLTGATNNSVSVAPM